jgi:hypothetical protein
MLFIYQQPVCCSVRRVCLCVFFSARRERESDVYLYIGIRPATFVIAIHYMREE